MIFVLLYGAMLAVPPLGMAAIGFAVWGVFGLTYYVVRRACCLFISQEKQPCLWCQRTTCSWALPREPPPTVAACDLPVATIHKEYSRWN